MQNFRPSYGEVGVLWMIEGGLRDSLVMKVGVGGGGRQSHLKVFRCDVLHSEHDLNAHRLNLPPLP